MKKAALFIILTCSLQSNADTVFGVYAGIQSWYYDNTVKFNDALDASQISNDFDIDNQSALSLYVALEHAVPFVPNFKLKNTDFSDRINNANSCVDIPVVNCLNEGEIDLSHTDLTMYYELLDNWVNLDLGLSAIYFTGQSELSNLKNTLSQNYSEFIPALYTKAEFKFPTTDLSASLTANVGTLTDNSIVDIELAAQYKFALGFSLEAGLRKHTVKFDDFDVLKVDSNATGVFGALNFHF